MMYVSALVESNEILSRDKDSWKALLGTKGSHLSIKTAKDDFPNSFQCEAGTDEQQWTELILNRRQQLGLQVNAFDKDLQACSSQIPDHIELENMKSVLEETATILDADTTEVGNINSCQLQSKPPYNVCFA